MKKKPVVSVIMGSDSDLTTMMNAADTLRKFGIAYELKISSAHRTPEKTAAFAKNAKKKGIKVIIAGAGGAAHLAGVIAAHTTLPVIGVPMETVLDGVDSLLSIVQMPAGIPVATVAVGKAGAINAAILAVQILGVSSSTINKKLEDHKKELIKKVEAKNKKIETTVLVTKQDRGKTRKNKKS
ncbi:MAG: 5-(carboxyamino)imidazole ribonucleotide mutase [Candidatus Omnitrophica bacterium]|nr:5-(carboxyamino)imidazole ribonucleotide mutase [Candidatus Omnitrophota bacterium]